MSKRLRQPRQVSDALLRAKELLATEQFKGLETLYEKSEEEAVETVISLELHDVQAYAVDIYCMMQKLRALRMLLEDVRKKANRVPDVIESEEQDRPDNQ